MRITGGTLKGRRVIVPAGRVRPTSDMVRQALCSIIAGRIAGARFLDLYAGSGAVGLEAWSRGADFVEWVEIDRRHLAVLKDNVAALCEGQGRVWHGEAVRFLRREAADEAFDVIFADPPYDRSGKSDTLRRLLAAVSDSILEPDGIFVYETDSREAVEATDGWRLLDEKTYGGTKLAFLVRVARRAKSEPSEARGLVESG